MNKNSSTVNRAMVRLNRVQTAIDELRTILAQFESEAAPGQATLQTTPAFASTGDSIAKTLRYWKRSMTPAKIWEIMKRRGYTTSNSNWPSPAVREALQNDPRFVQITPGRYSLAPLQ